MPTCPPPLKLLPELEDLRVWARLGYQVEAVKVDSEFGGLVVPFCNLSELEIDFEV